MRERPILFSGPMVRAILAGRKTQTRRPVKLPPIRLGHYHEDGSDEWEFVPTDNDGDVADEPSQVRRCPYGKPGDRLWVRETHCIVSYPCWSGLPYTSSPFEQEYCYFRAGFDRTHPSRWRPSIHMPRWASRITLKVTGVRVERLQDISEEDALAEGHGSNAPCRVKLAGMNVARTWFRGVWATTVSHWKHPEHSWEANPHVWVITFRRLEAKT